jgi:hypothetical protein
VRAAELEWQRNVKVLVISAQLRKILFYVFKTLLKNFFLILHNGIFCFENSEADRLNYFIVFIFTHAISLLNTKKFGNSRLHFGFSGLIDPAVTDFDDFRSDYLGEYEAICETGFAC